MDAQSRATDALIAAGRRLGARGPDLGGRGQPVGPARRRARAGHADGSAQGRARARRPRRRLARRTRTATRDLANGGRPTSDLAIHLATLRGAARSRRRGPRPPAGLDGASRSPARCRIRRPCRRRRCSCRACPTCRSARWAASSWPAASRPPCPSRPSRSRTPSSSSGTERSRSAPTSDQAVDRLELVEVLCRTWRDALLIRAATSRSLGMVDDAQVHGGNARREHERSAPTSRSFSARSCS